MALTDWEKAKVIGTGRATGSIQRIYASTAITITDSTLGRFVSVVDSGSVEVDINSANSQNKVHQTTTDDINIPAGSYVDGPFIAINVSAGRGVMYYNGNLATVGS